MAQEQTQIQAAHDSDLRLPDGHATTTAIVPTRVSFARRAFRLLAWLFAACVVIQVFIAGLAVFADPARWAWHRNFVHAFEFLPLIMLLLAFLGRLPARMRWLTVAAFGLLWVQYATSGIGGIAGAFHPVTALLIFWLSITLARAPIRDDVQALAHSPATGGPSGP